MARLKSQIKMGYYPTPKEVIDNIASRIELSYEMDINALDPCCGEGDALATIKNYSGITKQFIKTYGIELDTNRYLTAKKKIDKILNCDALNEAMVNEESFDLLFLNPPYDDGDEEDNRERVELTFLKKYTPTLNSSFFSRGLLIFIVPLNTLKFSLIYLRNHYEDIYIEPFPEKLFSVFKQVVVYARRYDAYKQITQDDIKEDIAKIKLTDMDNYEDVKDVCEHISNILRPESIKINNCNNKVMVWRKQLLNPEQMLDVISSESVVHNKFLSLYNKPYQGKTVVPLTNLRKGHLAMLIASGLLNGDVEKDGKKYTIKGFIKRERETKTEIIVDNDTEQEKTVSRTKHNIIINVYDHQKNKFFKVQ